ncbi:MAG: 2'-5' RNA ligase family protein [Candidatus Heimdallarchaeaceae archaeon]
MHGLVSLLDEIHTREIEKIWKNLEEKFGLKGIRVTPYPHFSWEIAEHYNLGLLEELMDEIVKTIKPFKVRTTGLGIFTSERPVLFIPLVKTAPLVKLHQKIWTEFNKAGIGISNYYSPEFWVPHISLAYGDLTKDKLGSAVQYLYMQDFNWEIMIDNISFIYEPNGQIGELMFVKKFKGKSVLID